MSLSKTSKEELPSQKSSARKELGQEGKDDVMSGTRTQNPPQIRPKPQVIPPICFSLRRAKFSLDNIYFMKLHKTRENACEKDFDWFEFRDQLRGIDRKTMAKKYTWYWGDLSAADAEYKLTGHRNGAFLVRDSESGGHFLTLSFLSQDRIFHQHLYRRSGFWVIDDIRGYHSLGDLITSLMMVSKTSPIFCVRGESTEFPLLLKFPICRLGKIYSLKELCRDGIQQKVRDINGLDKLPLPQQLIDYLKEDFYAVYKYDYPHIYKN